MGALCGVIPLIKSTWPYPSAVELQLTPLNSIGFVGKIKHYTHSNPPVINWANRIPTDVWITMFAESNTFNELTNPWKCWTIKKFTSELPPNITNDTEIDFCQSSRVRVSRPIFLKKYWQLWPGIEPRTFWLPFKRGSLFASFGAGFCYGGHNLAISSWLLPKLL